MVQFNNYGEELDVDGLRDEFFMLTPTEELAKRYEISEEQVFEEIGGHAEVLTVNGSSYWFDFDSPVATVKRVPGEFGLPLREDTDAVPLLSIQSWKPYLDMFIDVRGDGVVTRRVTSDVTNIYFY